MIRRTCRGLSPPGVIGLLLAFIGLGGDGNYVRDRVQLDTLNRYSTILVPSPIDPTENQRQTIKQFVRSGRTLVCQEPEQIGIGVEFEPDDRPYLAGSASLGKGRVFRLAGEVTSTWTNDVGAEFFKRYDSDLRNQIHGLADAVGAESILDEKYNGVVGAFPVVQPRRKRIVVHLVNYDVDTKKDKIREKTEVRVKLPMAMEGSGSLRAEIYTLDAMKPQPVPLEHSGETVSCTIPRLGCAATLVIRTK